MINHLTIVYGLVHVLEQYYCSGGCLLSCAFSVRDVYVYKTLGDHILVLCGLYFLYHTRNEKPPARMLLHPYPGRETIIQFGMALV